MGNKENIITFIEQAKRASLGTFPTPVQRLYNTEKEMSYKDIYIKRDDLTGIGPGGNKIRSLDFILGDAMGKGCNVMIASGQVTSNLCTLAAASCARLGLRCVLVHNSKKPDGRSGNALLNYILGVESIFIGSVTQQEREQYVEDLCQKLIKEGQHPYLIKNGATTGMGTLGYTDAVIELMRQCREQNLPIKTIFAPGGNGGVATGLIYGNALLGFPFKVVIISVEDDTPTLSEHIQSTIAEMEQITNIPFGCKLEDACCITDEYRGEGWSYNTPESEQEIFNFARREGIFIENVYNSKVVVGLKDYIRKSKVEGGLLYLHTGGFGSLFSQY